MILLPSLHTEALLYLVVGRGLTPQKAITTVSVWSSGVDGHAKRGDGVGEATASQNPRWPETMELGRPQLGPEPVSSPACFTPNKKATSFRALSEFTSTGIHLDV